MKQGFGALLITILCVPLARGQEAAQGSLARAAREAASAFKPVTAADVAQAKAEYSTALKQLERHLAGLRTANRTGWKQHLSWSELQSIASRKEPPEASLVAALVEKFTADKRGLELPPFTRVRQTLQTYADTAAAASNTQLMDEYEQRLERLALHFEAYEKNPASGDDAIAIAQNLGWMKRSRQADNLLAAVHGAYYQPNVLGFTSKRLMAAGVEEDVDRVSPIRDVILGTSIRGTGRMRGRTTLVLHDNPNAASYSVLLGGRVYSNNVGYNGPATIFTTGVTSISARKQVNMTEAGMVALPAAASARTSTRINGISAKRRLVQRIAWKRAGQQQGQAAAIGSAHARSRIAREMDQQSGALIGEQNENYQAKFRRPLLRRGAFPEDITFSSTSEQIKLVMTQAHVGQLGAPVSAPSYEGEHDLAFRAHESAVINYGETVLGGTTMTDEELVKIIRDDLKREVPEELQITPDKDPWSITFAREVPFRAQFVDQTVKMALRGTQFTRGEQGINEPIEISAVYNVEKANGGSKLVRQGDVEVTFLQRERLGATQVAFKTFLRRKFEAMFKPEFESDGLQLKGRLAKAGKLQLKELKSDDAWLVLGWEMPPQPAAAQVAAD